MAVVSIKATSVSLYLVGRIGAVTASYSNRKSFLGHSNQRQITGGGLIRRWDSRLGSLIKLSAAEIGVVDIDIPMIVVVTQSIVPARFRFRP